MKKSEIIGRYGEAEYKRRLEQQRAYYEAHKKEAKARNREKSRKGGKHYDKHLIDSQTGIPGDKNKIRHKHARDYKQYKDIIAPDSEIHHEWVPKTADYRGLALVEAEQHMHGFVDVIRILYGEITLLTEEEVKRGKENEK